MLSNIYKLACIQCLEFALNKGIVIKKKTAIKHKLFSYKRLCLCFILPPDRKINGNNAWNNHHFTLLKVSILYFNFWSSTYFCYFFPVWGKRFKRVTIKLSTIAILLERFWLSWHKNTQCKCHRHEQFHNLRPTVISVNVSSLLEPESIGSIMYNVLIHLMCYWFWRIKLREL